MWQTGLTFHASSKSAGRMTYRFFRTAWGQHAWAECVEEAHLADLLLDRSKQFQPNSTCPVVKRLDHQLPLFWRKPGGLQSSKSTSGPRFIFDVTVWNIRRLSRRDGRGNSIFLSNRPGRNKAGSSVSCRFVAMMTCTSDDISLLALSGPP